MTVDITSAKLAENVAPFEQVAFTGTALPSTHLITCTARETFHAVADNAK